MPKTTQAQKTFKTAYGSNQRVQLECNDSSRTKQNFQKECDINTIMGKYKKSGLLSHVAKFQGNYDILPSEIDFHASQNAIIAANESFDSLPASIRTEFQNDPGLFLKMVDDPDNHDRMVELGLIKPTPPGANQNTKNVTADPATGGPEDKSKDDEASEA